MTNGKLSRPRLMRLKMMPMVWMDNGRLLEMEILQALAHDQMDETAAALARLLDILPD
ncbi:MAG: hypothetical protein M5U34_34495 [Chloroflexi bacterium]|nr:hypothetical protein [Chloroflexota bacterium]